MKQLRELLESVSAVDLRGNDAQTIEQLTFDSRTAGAGSCFFAICGTATDGHQYIEKAVAQGARCIVCQTLPDNIDPNVCYVKVEETNAALADMASAFYSHPSRELKLVGVTGTNGKTTTATLLYDLFRSMGHKVGLISTVVYHIDERTIDSTHTTPDPIRLAQMMREMVDCGCDYCFMEVSSHALAQQRVRGLRFEGAIFTNITHDHLDYHKTFAEYIRVKKSLFDSLSKQAFAVVNVDDRNGRVMVQNCAARVRTLSLTGVADFKCKILETHPDGMLLAIDRNEVWVKFLGRFNAYNLLGVYAAAVMLGVEADQVLRHLSTLHSVSGRFEALHSSNGITAIVDYAHTPDALENVIATIEEIRREGQHLTVVCGCGGDRDKTKRPEMAQIAIRHADRAIFTSDNPRTESPEAILDDMTSSLPEGSKYLRITDRAEAIKTAVMLSAPGDIILVAGKGHENYQIIGTTKHHFDDKEQIAKAFDFCK